MENSMTMVYRNANASLSLNLNEHHIPYPTPPKPPSQLIATNVLDGLGDTPRALDGMD